LAHRLLDRRSGCGSLGDARASTQRRAVLPAVRDGPIRAGRSIPSAHRVPPKEFRRIFAEMTLDMLWQYGKLAIDETGRGIMTSERYRLKAEIIKAMAHPSRLMIIDALAEGEKCVCELQQIVGSDMSTVSKHLSVMKNAGVVRDRKAGQQVFYSLRVPCIQQFFGCVEAVMAARFAAVEQAVA
jgi:ArsR family transcriptional regulator